MFRLDDFSYKKLLAAAYQKVTVEATQPRLINPTRGNLRQECFEKCQGPIQKKDEPVLYTFFKGLPEGEILRNWIEYYSLDKFRSLQSYMDNTEIDTDDVNVNLLAWLIDFKHRPNRIDNFVELTDEEKNILGIRDMTDEAPANDVKELVEGKPEKEVLAIPELVVGSNFPADVNKLPENSKVPQPEIKISEEDPDKKTGWINSMPAWVKRTSVLVGIAAIGTGGYRILATPSEKKCMYWTGDRYEKISCSEKANGRFIIPIDEDEAQIQKINREDTIKEEHIGKLYYIKHNNDIQYFTQGGRFPQDLSRELQKLSRHIYDKDSVNRRRTAGVL